MLFLGIDSENLPLKSNLGGAGTENYRPIRFLSKISLVFARHILNYLSELSKNQTDPKLFGFKFGENALVQLIVNLKTLQPNNAPTRISVFPIMQKRLIKSHIIFLIKLKSFRFEPELFKLVLS